MFPKSEAVRNRSVDLVDLVSQKMASTDKEQRYLAEPNSTYLQGNWLDCVAPKSEGFRAEHTISLNKDLKVPRWKDPSSA